MTDATLDVNPHPALAGHCHCGAVHWQFSAAAACATACSCTLCRRYGALWIYDYEHSGVTLAGPTAAYRPGPAIDFLFCTQCHCLVGWRGLALQPDGRRRMAVNARMAEPAAVGHLVVEHLDGLDTWEGHFDGRRVSDYWY